METLQDVVDFLYELLIFYILTTLNDSFRLRRILSMYGRYYLLKYHVGTGLRIVSYQDRISLA